MPDISQRIDLRADEPTSSMVIPPCELMVPDQRAHWNAWHQRHQRACHPDHAMLSRGLFLNELGSTSPIAQRRVLELGCGQAYDAISFARQGIDVVGVDHSDDAIDLATELSRAQSPTISNRIELYRSDYFTYLETCSPREFDGVYSHLSLHYFDAGTTNTLFNEVERVLSPGGVFLFTVRARGDELEKRGFEIAPNVYCSNGHVRHFFSVDLVWHLLRGWDVCRVDQYKRTSGDEDINPGSFIRGLARRSM